MLAKQTSVADVMTIGMTVVGVDATLEEADLVLRSTFITGMPVVDDSGVLVGVITDADVAAYRFAHRLGDEAHDGQDPADGPARRVAP